MIERYRVKEIEEIFSEEEKLRVWLDIELRVLKVLEENGKIPQGEYEKLSGLLNNLDVNLLREKMNEFEKETGHDVVAFLWALGQILGEENVRYLHYGLTSYDIVDTALSLMLKRAGELLLSELDELMTVLKDLSLTYKGVKIMGRTHGMYAEPTSLGLKFLGYYEGFKRIRGYLEVSLENLRYGKISGVVGTSSHLGVEIEKKILESLGLKREPVSTQVIPRDRLAKFFTDLAILGGWVERIATEIRLLQRTEVGEVQEPFGAKQTGSSAMPHKKNPVLSERLCGFARYLRGLVIPILENISLWHERDITHSSVERIAIPDVFHISVNMLRTLRFILKGIHVDFARIEENLTAFGDFYYSELLMMKLIEKGFSRRKAYYKVQELIKTSMSSKSSLRETCLRDGDIKIILHNEELEEIFNFDFLRNEGDIYKEVL